MSVIQSEVTTPTEVQIEGIPIRGIVDTGFDTVWHENFKFYGFTVVGRTVKLKSVNFYYCVAKILGCFNNCKI